LPFFLVEAEKGNAGAMLTIGNIYERGLYNNPRNYGKSLEWYQKAAEKGLAEGFFNVGISYEIGQGVAPNPQIAFENFLKAAEKGLPIAKHKLGQLYLLGQGVLADPQAAIRYFSEAGKEGLPDSEFLLARLYLNGTGGIPKDPKKGIEILTRLAQNNYALALNELGVIYYLGQYDTKKDLKKAEENFIKAADLGSGDAMKNLGAFYMGSEGGPPAKLTDALKWFTLSTAFGYNTQDIVSVIQDLRSKMKAEEIKAAETAVTEWINKKNAEATAARAAQNQQTLSSPQSAPAAN
jgi:TPR repeat protein